MLIQFIGKIKKAGVTVTVTPALLCCDKKIFQQFDIALYSFF